MKITKQLVDLKKDYVKAAKELTKQAFAEYFEKFPGVESLGWRQYAPSFNDGDPCVFRVNTYDIVIRAVGAEVDGDKDFYDSGHFAYASKEREAAALLLKSIDSSIMEDMYGDGSEVTVSRNGKVQIDEYYSE